MDSFLNARTDATADGTPTFMFERLDDPAAARAPGPATGAVAGAMPIERGDDGGLDFTVLSVGGLSPDRAQLLQVGAFAVGILDWTASQPPSSSPFVIPGFEVSDPNVADGGAGAARGRGDDRRRRSTRAAGSSASCSSCSRS